MAAIMTKRGSQDNVVTYEHICDTRADMASIDDRYATLGSTCIVLKDGSGGIEVYIADSNHNWKSLIVAGAGGGSGESTDNSIISTLPTTDGTYTLQVTVSNGTPTYSWMPDIPSARGVSF